MSHIDLVTAIAAGQRPKDIDADEVGYIPDGTISHRDIGNSATVAAAVPADAEQATLDAGWHCFAMTFDHGRNELTGWLDGQAGDRWLDALQNDKLLSFAANAWLQGRLRRQVGMQEGEDPAFPESQFYTPPEDEPVAVSVVSQSVGFAGWIGGVAVFDRPLSAAKLRGLAAVTAVAAAADIPVP